MSSAPEFTAPAPPADSSPSIQVGDVVFSPVRVALIRGGQLVTSVRKDAIHSLDIGSDPESANSGREVIWGGGAIVAAVIGGGASLAQPEVSVKSIIFSVVVFLAGILLLRSAARTTTFVRVSGANGQAALPLGVELEADQITALKYRLRKELGYPIAEPPAPRPRDCE